MSDLSGCADDLIWVLPLLAPALLSVGTATAQLVVNLVFNAIIGTFSGPGAFSDPGHDFWNGVSSTARGTSVNGSFVVAPGHAEAELNGLQIVAVPESSTLAYGSLGSAMILTRAVFLRRRRQRSALGSARSTAAA